MHLSRSLLAALAFWLTAVTPANAQDTHIGGVGSGDPDHDPAYDIGQLYEHIKAVYGETKADAIQSAVAGPGATIGLAELRQPDTEWGAHDRDTIQLNTKDPQGRIKIDPFGAAMILVHEYDHTTRCGGGSPPPTFDPTALGPCGACSHAQDFYAQAAHIRTSLCPLTLGNYASVCQGIKRALDAGDNAFSRCKADLCSQEHDAAAAARKSANDAYVRCCTL